ncbi:hypothetical protein SCOR_32115 [Sulfidibacter corallicola]|uniref:Uncharacterized protein n=1 Tax=Sulfidibacter corallicola TaxID=2818388 RepID=A0A8A4TLP8_SULCO|nr:hypothetical protein [Sulfidibacter corallicola]QTD49811.1 hypothetical protein J3U87_29865 [Sulfidibacter corallicola]
MRPYSRWMLLASALAMSVPVVAATPTDVYYLAQSLKSSVAQAYQLPQPKSIDYLTHNIKPRNVFQKAMGTLSEFETLFPGSIEASVLDAANAKEARSISPDDVFELLGHLRDAMQAKGFYRTDAGPRSAKVPSDVFHRLQHLSARFRQLAAKRGVTVNWGTPERVFALNFREVYPILRQFVTGKRGTPEAFVFRAKGAPDVKPRHIFAFQSTLYHQIGKHYRKERNYDPIVFEDYTQMDRITPDDVYHISLIVIGEIKFLMGDHELAPEELRQFENWKRTKNKIGPGDVYHLLRHNFFMTVKAIQDSRL